MTEAVTILHRAANVLRFAAANLDRTHPAIAAECRAVATELGRDLPPTEAQRQQAEQYAAHPGGTFTGD